jgi:hypothetical protein
MHSNPQLPEQVCAPFNRHRRTTFKVGIIALSVLLLALIFFFSSSTPSDDKLVWLTAGELARTKQGSPFRRMKDKLMGWTAAHWKSFWSSRPQILIDSRLLTLSKAAADQTDLGAPVATNSDGARAWILSPAELSGLLQRLKTMPDASLLSRPRAQTAASTSANVFFGETRLVSGTNFPIGLTLDVTPKVRSGSIQVLIGFTSTAFVLSPPANAPAVSTNLAVACRVMLPNSGGLVVAGSNASHAQGTNYWLILSPTAVGARGNPIKL